VKSKLAKFPKLNAVETIIDEWNMSLEQPILSPQFQPAFVLETTFDFWEEGLSRSAYYHIQDVFVDEQRAARFLSPSGAALGARWWNDLPQYTGLYDNQGQARPAYYAFKLVSLIKGQKITVRGGTANLRTIGARRGKEINVLIWNWPANGPGDEDEVTVRFPANQKGRFMLARLNSTNHFNQLEVLQRGVMGELDSKPLQFRLQPYEIRWLNLP